MMAKTGSDEMKTTMVGRRKSTLWWSVSSCIIWFRWNRTRDGTRSVWFYISEIVPSHTFFAGASDIVTCIQLSSNASGASRKPAAVANINMKMRRDQRLRFRSLEMNHFKGIVAVGQVPYTLIVLIVSSVFYLCHDWCLTWLDSWI